MLTIRGSLVDASLLEGGRVTPQLGAHWSGWHPRQGRSGAPPFARPDASRVGRWSDAPPPSAWGVDAGGTGRRGLRRGRSGAGAGGAGPLGRAPLSLPRCVQGGVGASEAPPARDVGAGGTGGRWHGRGWGGAGAGGGGPAAPVCCGGQGGVGPSGERAGRGSMWRRIRFRGQGHKSHFMSTFCFEIR